VLVRDGERHEGLARLRDWLLEVRPTGLWIVDPYFVPTSLEVLLLVQEASPNCEVVVLTGKDVHKRVEAPYEDTYRDTWWRLANQEPPPTRIVIVGTARTGKCPVHDRWWLTSGAGGLRLGTSVNGIGGRWSEIERVDHGTAALRLQELMPFLVQGARAFESEVLKYSVLTL
jgi:hypothetical protein